MKKADLTGMRFGKLTVVEDSGKRTKNGTVVWKCVCDCGNTAFVSANNLKSKGHPTISCGCERKKRFMKNGYTILDKRLYNIFSGMKERCYNPKHPRYKNYGGKGVKICDEWLFDYMKFYNWAVENGYGEKLTIDRKDNSGDYSPFNCRWVPAEKQSGNRSTCVMISFKGESHCIAEWARITGIKESTLGARIRNGWPLEKALKK